MAVAVPSRNSRDELLAEGGPLGRTDPPPAGSALALAEVTSAYPTSGALYYMADRLGGRRWGWYT
ncbi:hypothetical protein ACISU4_27780, partial [Streptomyces wuyuanensis]|uniref:hypothetical protein n=1 Tax=Streptomyces wuyuanensis TaxID=1196353 RepID=UPI0038168261